MDNALSFNIACYFFLAGAGSGAYIVSVFLQSRAGLSMWGAIQEPPFTFAEAATAMSVALVACGCLFLLFDLGWPALFPLVFRMPHVSIISFGALSIALFCILATLRIVFGRIAPLRVRKSLSAVLTWTAWLCALATATYTGVFLFSMKAIPFWNSPWIIALFVLSSLSTGTVCLLALAASIRAFLRTSVPSLLCRIDSIFLLLEIAVLALFVTSRLNGSPTAQKTAEAFLFGPDAFWFWIVLVGAGLAMPLVAERLFLRRDDVAYAHVATAGTLAGGLALRCCIIFV